MDDIRDVWLQPVSLDQTARGTCRSMERGTVNTDSGASGDLFVAPNEVSDVGRYAYRIAQELLSGLNAVDGELDSLATTWTGNAGSAYAAGWKELHGGARQVLEALTDMAELLGVTAANYEVQDQHTEAAVSSLRLGTD